MKNGQNNSIHNFTEIEPYLREDGAILNIWGEKGIGKTYVLQKFESSIQKGRHSQLNSTQIEWLDFSQFTELNEMTRVEILYSICHILKDKFRISNPIRFLMADRVDSERKKRKSYLERQEFASLNTASEAYDIVSVFFEISGVSKALKLAQLGDKVRKKIPPLGGDEKEYYSKYKKLAVEKDLTNELPRILKKDLEKPVQNKGDKASLKNEGKTRKIVVIDNFNPDKPEFENWTNSLIDNNQEIIWILVSRQKLMLQNKKVQFLEICPLDKDQVSRLSGIERTDDNRELLDKLYTLTRGVPLLVNLLASRVHSDMDDSKWQILEKDMSSTDFIAKSVLESMDVNKKELLFHLAFVSDFDAQTFSHLFPGKFFWLYADWFETSIFTRHGEAYQVQQSVKDSLIEYIRHRYAAAVDVINKELFLVERNWLQLNVRAAADNSIRDHIVKFCEYGKELEDCLLFYDGLLQLKDTVLKNKGHYYYQVQLNDFLSRLNSDSSIDNDFLSSLQISVYEELCNSEIQCGQLEKARGHAKKALEILPDPEIEPGALHLYFYGILLQAEYSSHDIDPGKNWVSVIKDNGDRYFRILQRLEISAFYKFELCCEAAQIVIKSLINNSEYEESEKLLTAIKKGFDVLPQVQQAKYYKQMGKIWQLDGERLHNSAGKSEDRIGGYRKSAKALQVSAQYFEYAEAVSQEWDQDLLLESGLTFKRSAENSFKLEDPAANHEQAFHYIDKALEQYFKVIEHTNDVVEAYSRIGWAYLTKLHNIWKEPEYFT